MEISKPRPQTVILTEAQLRRLNQAIGAVFGASLTQLEKSPLQSVARFKGVTLNAWRNTHNNTIKVFQQGSSCQLLTLMIEEISG